MLLVGGAGEKFCDGEAYGILQLEAERKLFESVVMRADKRVKAQEDRARLFLEELHALHFKNRVASLTCLAHSPTKSPPQPTPNPPH